jgi:hypothetical protein
MHFVISWDIKAEGQRRTQIENDLKACITGYSWVHSLTTFYIVKVNSQTDWDSILTKLQAVGRKYTPDVNFVLTPLMSGGRYDGWLPKDLWTKIGERTK